MFTIGVDAHDLEGKRTGVGRYVFNILRSWAESGLSQQHRIVLFFQQSAPADLPGGFEVRVLRPTKPPGKLKSSKALFMHVLLPQAAKRIGVNVLFCPGYVAPLTWRKPLVLTLHDIVYETHSELFNWQGPQDRFLLKFVSRNAAKRAQKVLVPSNFTASEVRRSYKVAPERIVVTPEAAEDSFRPFAARTLDPAIAQQYGITGPYLFFVGSIFTRRHIPECIQAFTRLTSEFPRHQFLIAGQSYLKLRAKTDVSAGANLRQSGLNGIISEANVRARRRAIDWVPYAEQADLPALYNGADGTVWLSDYEGFGLPPLESLACGTPVLTARTTALPETVGDLAIFISNTNNVDEIVNGMRELITNNTLRQRVLIKGPEHAARFSWKRCAQQTLDAILAAANS